MLQTRADERAGGELLRPGRKPRPSARSPKPRALTEGPQPRRRAATALAPAAQPLPAPGAGALSGHRDWLHTALSWIVRSTGRIVVPRGVNIVVADMAADEIPSWRTGLGLSDEAFTLLADTWQVDLIQVTLPPAAVLGADALGLASLDDLIACAADAGMHTLLAVDVPEPPGAAAIADSDMVAALTLLAARYQAEPAVLFDLCPPDATLPRDWPLAALVAIGLTREQHPASLIFVPGAARPELASAFPLRVVADTAVPHLVYTLAVGHGAPPLGPQSPMRPFLQRWPTLASKWSPGGVGLSPMADIEALQLEQTATGFAAWNWNVEPRLVTDAPRGDFAATGTGLMVQRALSRPALEMAATFGRL